jgi:tRNA (guanine-N7-)-methyltransferase
VKNAREQKLKFYGRKIGRRLSARKKILLKSNLEKILITDISNYSNQKTLKFFDKQYKEIWLEVGFGNGSFLIDQAIKRPQVGFLGCDFYLNGIANLTEKIINNKINNIKICMEHIYSLLSILEEKMLSNVSILFPDPWHKKKHFKRRVLNVESIKKFQIVMKKHAKIFIVTDSDSYMNWIIEHFALNKSFSFVKNCESNFLKQFDLDTKYFHKAIMNKKQVHFLSFIKE